ncbi:hypothetical protein DIPPA_03185 [Diplonema papillatum]|nr:hypothetical protein DIPPA_03185 [Diplonema papillatum]
MDVFSTWGGKDWTCWWDAFEDGTSGKKGQKRVNLVGGGDPAHGGRRAQATTTDACSTICRCAESAAKRQKRGPSPPGTPEATPKSRRKLRPSAQSATREAADAGANTAIKNAAEGDDTRTAAGNEAAA